MSEYKVVNSHVWRKRHPETCSYNGHYIVLKDGNYLKECESKFYAERFVEVEMENDNSIVNKLKNNKMTSEFFKSISMDDIRSRVVIDALYLALKEKEDMEMKIDKVKNILTMGHTIREREAFKVLDDKTEG